MKRDNKRWHVWQRHQPGDLVSVLQGEIQCRSFGVDIILEYYVCLEYYIIYFVIGILNAFPQNVCVVNEIIYIFLNYVLNVYKYTSLVDHTNSTAASQKYI